MLFSARLQDAFGAFALLLFCRNPQDAIAALFDFIGAPPDVGDLLRPRDGPRGRQ
jgi:hypothetical protein